MHLDLLTTQYMRAGMSPAEARRAARAKFGGVTQIKESLREQAGVPDARIDRPGRALRGARARRGEGVRHRERADAGPRPRRQHDELHACKWVGAALVAVRGCRRVGGPERGATEIGTYAGNSSQPGASRIGGGTRALFKGVAVYEWVRFNVHFGRGGAERRDAARVSAELLPLVGIDPILGRHFLPEGDRPAARRVALVSYDLWQRQFKGDPSVLGRTVYLDDRAYFGPSGSPISVEVDHLFRSKWITDFGGSGSLSAEVDHRFRG